MRKYVISEQYEGSRFDRFASKALKDCSKSSVQKMIRTGRIKLNARKASADTRLKTGDEVTFYTDLSANSDQPALLDIPYPEILYEDEHLLAVNKPAGLLIHPDGRKAISLTQMIENYLIKQNTGDGLFVPGVINRLDFNTSGIVLSPKTPLSAKRLYELSRSGGITKRYLALVKGEFKNPVRATHYFTKDDDVNKVILSDETGKDDFQMESIFEPVSANREVSLICAVLITGRTHQIRAQLSYMGYPVVGDMKYGVNAREDYKKYGIKRHFLHCSHVELTGLDGKRIKIFSPLADDLKRSLKNCNIKSDTA